ncbi:TadE/TadG family protein [Thalassobius sp. Cn5-15]|uniref:TadE/TadG family type IV pilus assembly protein n=1 Tax=Thalassobius sp. Cn5-15 TaxID=2917763 RepID=UPI001EF3481B|nr:TadE/TadG family protein [Thalassobius sp. Cn5-15]MCG7492997.1 TadE/TadG family protein [Thalassobius sp. Cn5-15]
MKRTHRLHMPRQMAQGCAKAARRLDHFGRDESGAVLLFAMFMLTCMLMIGGVGIDLMRFERDRMSLQNTLDSAVLAAADLDQTQPARQVVEDYFQKAGVGASLTSVNVDEGIGFRSVSVTAESKINTHFMKLFNIKTLTAPATGKAEERIDGIEISLVLDVSGSMNSNSRLKRLRPAARSFVDTVLESAQEGNIYVSIVPYATQVAVGKNLLDQYTVSDEHEYSHCVNFASADFNRTSISPNTELDRTAHFDPWYHRELNEDSESDFHRVCATGNNLQVLPFSNNRTTLHNYINKLTARGNTSIDLGMKWGAALVDPSTQPVLTGLIDDGHAPNAFRGRPHEFNNSSTLKVVVLMTDGRNTNQYYLNDSVKSGASGVWYNAEAKVYSVYNGFYNNRHNYYWPDSGKYTDHPYGNGTYEECRWEWTRNRWGNWYQVQRCENVDEPGTAVNLTYPELWNRASLTWNRDENYGFDQNRQWKYYNSIRHYHGANTKDARTNAICTAAKNNGIVIFTVGFEAPDRGQNVLRKCASSDGHHFDVDGLAIDDAFESIAASIRKLRLVQ